MSLGTREQPNYVPMRARQLLAAPYGFVWRVEAGGAIRFSGSDGADASTSWSRFWLLDTIPVVRAGGPDHRRAAFGRLIAEAVFWTPAALLPRAGVKWAAHDVSTARVTVEFEGLMQTVDLSVTETGQPTKIVFPRWTDANLEKVFRLQPFGGELHDFRDFDGYRLPTRIEAGNLYGTARSMVAALIASTLDRTVSSSFRCPLRSSAGKRIGSKARRRFTDPVGGLPEHNQRRSGRLVIERRSAACLAVIHGRLPVKHPNRGFLVIARRRDELV